MKNIEVKHPDIEKPLRIPVELFDDPTFDLGGFIRKWFMVHLSRIRAMEAMTAIVDGAGDRGLSDDERTTYAGIETQLDEGSAESR